MTVRRPWPNLLAVLTFVTASSAALAQNRARAPGRRAPESRRPHSVSLGYANSGRLQHAAHLDEDEAVRHLPGRVLHYGTDELVAMIRRAAHVVYRRHRVRLTVGDMSAPRGGPVGHHASHQSGRDADLCFYVVDRRGRSMLLNDYVGFGRDGRAMEGGVLRFDTPRNWALLEALLTDPVARVEHIFVSNGLRALLLAHARAAGASEALVARAEAALHQPTTGSPHANHFHVRIACPRGGGACVDGVLPPPQPRRGLARREPARATGRVGPVARREPTEPRTRAAH